VGFLISAGKKTVLVSNSPDETTSIGNRIAKAICGAGTVVALAGTLGSGKTYLTKGIAHGLGINENLTSPTYTIINEYLLPDHSTFYHIDAYRLDNDKDFEDIGGIDVINSGGISVIEWSERLPGSIPDNAITVTLEITGPTSRRIEITGLEKI
jgi:tRNA threonylcarbamoyladenosine biosynthesis protein TsaE